MKNLLFLLILSIFFVTSSCKNSFASQFEEVNLNIYESQKLTAPKMNSQVFSRVNYDGEIISDDEYYDDSEYFRPEEDLSRNKAEQKFQKFVDNVIINNKLNNYASKVGGK